MTFNCLPLLELTVQLWLSRLLNIIADTPINDNIMAWQGEDAKLFTGMCQVKYDAVLGTQEWLQGIAGAQFHCPPEQS